MAPACLVDLLCCTCVCVCFLCMFLSQSAPWEDLDDPDEEEEEEVSPFPHPPFEHFSFFRLGSSGPFVYTCALQVVVVRSCEFVSVHDYFV